MLRHHCPPRFPGPSCWGRLPARPCPEGPPPTRSVCPSPCDSVALGPGVSRLLTQNKFTDFGPRLGLLEQEQPRSPENLWRQLRHRPLPPGLMSSQAVPSLPLAKSTVRKPLCEALRVLLLGVISFLSAQGSSLKGTAGRLPGFPPGLEIWLTNDFTGKVEAGPGPPHGSRLSLGSLLWASCTVGHRPADAGQSLVSGQAGETDRGPRHATNKLRFLEKQSFGGVCPHLQWERSVLSGVNTTLRPCVSASSREHTDSVKSLVHAKTSRGCNTLLSSQLSARRRVFGRDQWSANTSWSLRTTCSFLNPGASRPFSFSLRIFLLFGKQ